MDRKDRVYRLSKLFSLRKEPFVSCAERLLNFGYTDIEIDIPICENGIDSEEYYAETRKMAVDFRHRDYRYRLEAQCYDGYVAPDNVCKIFSQLVQCIINPDAMCKTNVGKEFPNFLEKHLFFDISQDGVIDNNSANLIAFKGDTKYRMILDRNLEQESQANPCENNGNFVIASETIASYLEQFQKSLLAYKKLYAVKGDHRIELAEDMSRLDITVVHGWGRSSLSIRSESSSRQNTEELFRHLVHCWMRSKGRDDTFPWNLIDYGHIPQNFTDRYTSFEVVYHGTKYSITTRTDELVDFDSMDGHVFERFCAEILDYNGFEKVQVTQGSRDQGVDIIAYKDDIRYGIQCKCYSSDIGNKAVQEVYAGKAYYNCDVAVVLTNRYFTKSAVELAQRNRVHLWDRRKLSDLIENCKEQLLGTYKK